MNDLYNLQILRYASSIPHCTRLENPDITVTRTSRVCGSRLTIDAKVEAGKISAFGQDVKACAMGQACAAIVAKNVIGLCRDDFLSVSNAFEMMITKGSDVDWPDDVWKELEILKGLHGHPSRYGSVMLPFECLREVFDHQH